MKLTLCIALFILAIGFASCKKDKLIINEEKVFSQKDFVPSDPLLGGWRLNLRPDGSADVLPAGDIIYRGTYKIRSSSLNVTTDQAGDFKFEIISEKEIKEKKYGTILILN